MSPHAPLRPCRQPGCAALVAGGYCDEHRGAAVQVYDQQRGSSAVRGYGARHRWWRRVVLALHPVCTRCRRATSTVAHHVVALEDGGGWEIENGTGVCHGCHNQLTAQEGALRRDGSAGVVPPGPRGE